MFIIGSIIAGLISIGCLIGSVYRLFSLLTKKGNYIATSGVVIGLEKRIFNPGSAGVYCPVVEFKSNTGEIIRFESSFGTMPASNKEGDVVKIQ